MVCKDSLNGALIPRFNPARCFKIERDFGCFQSRLEHVGWQLNGGDDFTVLVDQFKAKSVFAFGPSIIDDARVGLSQKDMVWES